jgi:hypothetical protein
METLADAIENSKYVLICVSEPYRQKLSNRIESEYASRLKKQIVPLIMQKV